MTRLAGFDPTGFLRDHWQREPLLIPGALDFKDPLSPEELAGLALEDEVEARIIRQRGDSWELDNGPFREDSFDSDGPWTLLVQAVDQIVPEVTELRELVNFLPSWRLDDVMVSYASDGGGVGPHYDNYDVFLLQGMGQRRWQLGQRCDSTTALRKIRGLRILEEFEEQQEYLLSPGDILYVPPGVAHWGTAVGPCMTYSIGFRAPRLNDMLSRQADSLLEQLDPEQFYSDAELLTGEPGEITDTALNAALQQMANAVAELEHEADWFGELVTETRGAPILPHVNAPLPEAVVLDPVSRLAWRDGDAQLAVYTNGQTLFAGPGCRPLLIQICRGDTVTTEDLGEEATDLLLSLWYNGCLTDG